MAVIYAKEKPFWIRAVICANGAVSLFEVVGDGFQKYI
jgi:hypothetical protein